MTEDSNTSKELGQKPEWSDLPPPGTAEVVNLTPEGRSEIMGGEVVAKLRFGEPASEVHVVSVHTPNMDFDKLLSWNGNDPNLPATGGTVIIALNVAGDLSKGIAASALLIPGRQYTLGGKEGTVKWFKYSSMTDPVEPWTPFDTNPSLQEGAVTLDLASRHVVVESSNPSIPVQLSQTGFRPS